MDGWLGRQEIDDIVIRLRCTCSFTGRAGDEDGDACVFKIRPLWATNQVLGKGMFRDAMPQS